eukprot:TRINITY_DN14765_c0_g1_i2.p1 TRINITY_DN14765_c0_g1~~TRINITY_DN14765_c0_g1_i2.p1  ORF type:complete len:175 (-),score=36.50 TRINITY_DN14765_c0_g1_i2:695-1219(-)
MNLDTSTLSHEGDKSRSTERNERKVLHFRRSTSFAETHVTRNYRTSDRGLQQNEMENQLISIQNFLLVASRTLDVDLDVAALQDATQKLINSCNVVHMVLENTPQEKKTQLQLQLDRIQFAKQVGDNASRQAVSMKSSKSVQPTDSSSHTNSPKKHRVLKSSPTDVPESSQSGL